MPNKPKILVLTGVIIILASIFNLPVLTYLQSDVNGVAQMGIMGKFNLIPTVLILLLLLPRWKWRGVLWIIAGLVGALFTPVYAQALFSVSQSLGAEAQITLSDPTFAIGMLVVWVGYVVILAGSLWDLREQREGAR